MSEGKPRKRGSGVIDRRPLRFWEPFNIWWRSELEKTGQRASADDITRWYEAQAGHAWGPERPSLHQTRTHAKCLRSVTSVRDYFREYRAKKKHEQDELDMEEEEEGDRRSRSTASRRAAANRSKGANSNSTAAYSDGAVHPYMDYSNEQGYWGSGYMDGTTSGVTTAAADAAGSSQQDAAQGMAPEHAHLQACDMSCIHPGALDPTWASSYQQAAAGIFPPAVTTHGPIVPSTAQQGAYADQQQQDQHHSAGLTGAAGSAKDNNAQLWQQPIPPGPQQNYRQQQQQEGPQQQQQQQQYPWHIPASGATATAAAGAGRASLSSLFQVPPGSQLGGSLGAYELEVPCMSPRVKLEEGAELSAAAGVRGNTLTAPIGHQAGAALPPQDDPVAPVAPGSQQQQQPAQAQMQEWHAAEAQQQYTAAQQQQGYAWPPAALAFGGFAPQTSALHQPQQPLQQGTHSWWQQHSDSQPQQPFETAAGSSQPAMHAAAGCSMQQAGGQGHTHAGVPVAAGTPAHAAQAARRLSQSLEQLVLPQHRLSLHAMGSGLLDALTADGLDLDTFLGLADLPGAGGHGSLPGGAAAGDTIAPVAPGSRVSIRWLRGSYHMQVPEHWQQHIQALQEAPFRGGLTVGAMQAADPTAHAHDTAAGAAATAAPAGAAGGSLAFHLGRASSGGISALAEAAAATLAAHPDLMRYSGAAAVAAPPPPLAVAAADSQGVHETQGPGDAAGTAAASHKKRSRQQSPPTAGVSIPSAAGEGHGAAPHGCKRPCAPVGAETFKCVLDLASPRPSAQHPQQLVQLVDAQARQQNTLQQQPQQPQQQQQQVKSQQAELLGGQQAAAPASAALQAQTHAGSEQTTGQQPPAQQPPAQQPPAQDPCMVNARRAVVLDLRPEDLGATSENSLPSPPEHNMPQHGTAAQQAAQPQQQQQQCTSAGQGQQRGGRRIETLMLSGLQSPGTGATAAAGAGAAAGALGTRGYLPGGGPATAASTTGLGVHVGPDGAALPAPAMAHVAMAAAMSVPQGGHMGPQVLLGQQQQGFMGGVLGGGAPGLGGRGGAGVAGRESGKGSCRLPAMHEIERMI